MAPPKTGHGSLFLPIEIGFIFLLGRDFLVHSDEMTRLPQLVACCLLLALQQRLMTKFPFIFDRPWYMKSSSILNFHFFEDFWHVMYYFRGLNFITCSRFTFDENNLLPPDVIADKFHEVSSSALESCFPCLTKMRVDQLEPPWDSFEAEENGKADTWPRVWLPRDN